MKNPTKYAALTKAVDSFCQRHDLNRGHFADLLGYKGDNAVIQLNSTLNPTSDKTLNQSRETLLFDAFDETSIRIYFDTRMKPYGLETKPLHSATVPSMNFHLVLDDAMIESDEAFRAGKMALRDGTLDEAELKAIMKESDEAAKKHREVYEMAEARLRTLNDGGGR